MKLNLHAAFGALSVLALSVLGVFVPMAAQASSTATRNAQANVSTSASLNLTFSEGDVSTLTFFGAGGTSVSPAEGIITVHAQVTTDSANTSTVISVSSTDLTGASSGGTIPASALSWTHTADTGGGAWNAGTMSTDTATLASLPASGTYTGDQSYTMAIPANANADVYTGVVTYAITGF